MTNDDLNQIRGVVKEEVNTALEPIKKTLDEHTNTLSEHTNKLNVLWDQTVKLTESSTEVQENSDTQKVTLNQIAVNTENNENDMGKLNKRVSELEDRAGIVPPPELTIAR